MSHYPEEAPISNGHQTNQAAFKQMVEIYEALPLYRNGTHLRERPVGDNQRGRILQDRRTTIYATHTKPVRWTDPQLERVFVNVVYSCPGAGNVNEVTSFTLSPIGVEYVYFGPVYQRFEIAGAQVSLNGEDVKLTRNSARLSQATCEAFAKMQPQRFVDWVVEVLATEQYSKPPISLRLPGRIPPRTQHRRR